MIRYQIFLLLFVLGCKAGDSPKAIALKETLFSYQMGLFGEAVPKTEKRDYFRMGISYPFHENFIFGIVDFGNKYLIYKKVIDQDLKSYTCNGEIIVKSDYSMTIDSLVFLMKEIQVASGDGVLINDGGTWFVDYQLDHTKGKMDGVLLDDIKYFQKVLNISPFEFPDFAH